MVVDLLVGFHFTTASEDGLVDLVSDAVGKSPVERGARASVLGVVRGSRDIVIGHGSASGVGVP